MNKHIENTQALLHTQFDAFELHPCVLLDKHGKPVRHDDQDGMYYEQCDENDPDIGVWSIYGHLKQGGLEHISDHLEKKDAEEILQILEEEYFETKEDFDRED